MSRKIHRRYLQGGEKASIYPNSPNPELPLSPNRITHFEEGLNACKKGKLALSPYLEKADNISETSELSEVIAERYAEMGQGFLTPRNTTRMERNPSNMNAESNLNKFKELEVTDVFEDIDEETQETMENYNPSNLTLNRPPVRIMRSPKNATPKTAQKPKGKTYAEALEQELPLLGSKPENKHITQQRKVLPIKGQKRTLSLEEAGWVLSGKSLSQFGRPRTKLRMIYFLNMSRNFRNHIRAALRAFKIDTRKILDIGFVGYNITSLLVPDEYCQEIIEKMKLFPKAIYLEQFDMLDTTHMAKLAKYKDMPADQLRNEALRLARNRLFRQAESLPKSRVGTYNFLMMQANSLIINENGKFEVPVPV